MLVEYLEILKVWVNIVAKNDGMTTSRGRTKWNYSLLVPQEEKPWATESEQVERLSDETNDIERALLSKSKNNHVRGWNIVFKGYLRKKPLEESNHVSGRGCVN